MPTMLGRLAMAGKGSTGSLNQENMSPAGVSKWGYKVDRDRFLVQQQAFYVRGDVIVDIFQARGIAGTSSGDRNRNPYCVVLVEREKVGETPVAAKTLAPVWNHSVAVPHESVRKAADTNVWPVPYQPITIQMWDRSTTSDSLLGTARVSIADSLGSAHRHSWYKLVGAGDQTGDSDQFGKIRVKVRWESEALIDAETDEPRFYMRDVFGPNEKDYRHLYYGGLSSFFLAPPAGEEALLEIMSGITRHDLSANGNSRGMDGMLVLTELRLLFLPDIHVGPASIAFLEFHTVQVYIAAIRSFSHRGLEGGSRLLSITTRDGRTVHFRMPAAVSAARCGQWFDAERCRGLAGLGSGLGLGFGSGLAAAGEELWRRGLWGAGNSEMWMERLVEEIRWRKAQGDFVALWNRLCEATPKVTTVSSAASFDPGSTSTAPVSTPKSTHFVFSRGADGLSASAGAIGVGGRVRAAAAVAAAAGAAAASGSRSIAVGGKGKGGDAADGWGALERDLERVGVPSVGAGGPGYASVGRQMWEFKSVNRDYAMVPTYPRVLAFPSSITPAELMAAAPQRSRCRVPALVWLHPVSKAPLVRSSQPMAGMSAKVLSEDIFLLKQIRITLDATKISIVDARSLFNAKANQMTGKGYEDVNDIGRDVATLGFMGIENIHSVRDSFAAFCSATQTPGLEFYHGVGASGWLRHLSQIMKGAGFVVDELERGVAVLVHCSDGWDRTAQLTALAQLCLDPYYRTLEGFEVLVEKEWCSFGHMFSLRAHSDSPTESSPVFLQWLDAVWQVMRQYPSSFEFTGHYLERLVEGVYSAAFLNFSGNCERERREKLRDLQTAGKGATSIFAYLREHIMEGHMTAPMLNPLYRPPGQGHGGAGGSGAVGSRSLRKMVDVLRPCCELQGLELWLGVYMRDSLVLHNREKQLTVEQGLRLQVARSSAAIAATSRLQMAALAALGLIIAVAFTIDLLGISLERERQSSAGVVVFLMLAILLLLIVRPKTAYMSHAVTAG